LRVKRLLLLMSARTYRARDFLSASRKLGADIVIGIDVEPPLDAGMEAPVLKLDLEDVHESLAAIKAFARGMPFDAVVAVDDAGAALAAHAAAELGLPANPAESVVSAGNKAVFREICQAAGLPTPWFRELLPDENPGAIAASLDYPCVLKPLHLSASRGVIRADSPEEFLSAFRRVKALLQRPEVRRRSPDLTGRILVEGYLPGAEAALEGLVAGDDFRLLAFFDKPEPLYGPFFQETLYVTPSRHPKEIQAAAVRAVENAVRALGLRMGPVHAEVRINAGRVTLLDLAPRSIGGHCARALRFSRGWTVEELILVQALGVNPPEVERESPAAGVLMIPIPRAGVLRGIDGTENVRAMPSIDDVEILVPPGQRVEPPPEGDRYLGFVFARGGIPDKVEQVLREAWGLLHVRVDTQTESTTGFR
jgi:biotin carboxylase